MRAMKSDSTMYMKREMKVYRYTWLNSHTSVLVSCISANVTNMSSPLMSEKRHSDTVDRDRNWRTENSHQFAATCPENRDEKH